MRKFPYWYLLIVPTLVWYFGASLNALVMGINHAQMPVLAPGIECDPMWYIIHRDLLHACMNASTRFKFLADWIVIPDFGTASLGDMFEMLATTFTYPAWCVWIVLMIRDHNRCHGVK